MKRLAVILFTVHCSVITVFGATNTWFGDLDLTPSGAIVGDGNDLFRVGGSYNNETTNTAYTILSSTFEFTGSGAHNLEQFSIDRGPCAGNISNNFAFGSLKTAGTVTVVDAFANSAGNDAVYAQVILGTGTLVVTNGMRVYFGSTNGWAGTASVTGTGVFRPYLPDNLDSDGDGMVNSNECASCTDPANSASVLRITALAREGINIRVTWTTAGTCNCVLQTNAPPANGSFTNNFSDFSPVIAGPGSGESTTNHLDTGGATNKPSRFYRVRLVP